MRLKPPTVFAQPKILDASNKIGIADEHVVKNGRAKLLRIVSMLIKLSKRHRSA